MLPINLSSNKTTVESGKNYINENTHDTAIATQRKYTRQERRNNSFERKQTLLEKYNIKNQQLSKKWSDKLALLRFTHLLLLSMEYTPGSQKNNSSFGR